jgi:hypothetical protein
MVDEPTPAADDPNNALAGLRMIANGLIGGLLVIGAVLVVATFVALDGSILGDPWGDEALLLTVVGLVGGLGAVGFGLFLAPLIVGVHPRAITNMLGAYQAEWFIRAGAIEGGGIMMLVLFVFTGNPLLLAGAVIAVLALAAIFPSRDRFAAWKAARQID